MHKSLSTPISHWQSEVALLVGLGVMAGAAAPTTMPAPAVAQTSHFADVPSNHWAKDFIQALTAKQIIKGFPDGRFQPEKPVTRAEYAAIILKAFVKPEVRGEVSFSDVPQRHWAFSAIHGANTTGFLAGYPGGVFKPNQSIPRVQVLVSLANGLKYTPRGSTPTVLQAYRDAATIPEFARDSVAAATEKRIVVNYLDINLLNPNRRATRAEVAASIYQALVSAKQAKAVSSPFIVVSTQPSTTITIYVDPTRGDNDSRDGTSESTPYRTIAYALQRTQASTVIQLAPGSYSAESGEEFPLIFKSGVTLRGNATTKGQSIVIQGGDTYQTQTFRTQNIAILAQTDSKIIGVTITNPNTQGTGVWIESSSPAIENSTFTQNGREGIFVSGTGAPKIRNNVFTENNANDSAVAEEAQGEIQDNGFQNLGSGIAVSGAAAPLIVGNQITQNQDGIVVSDAARPVLRENVIDNNTRYGIVAIADAHPDLGTASSPGNNSILNNGQYDLYNGTSNDLMTTGSQIGTSNGKSIID